MHQRLDPAFDAVVDLDAAPETLIEGLATGEGPVWIAEEGCLVFTDVGIAPTGNKWSDLHEGRLWRWHPDRGSEIICEATGHAVGATRDQEGRLVICEAKGRRIVRQEASGELVTLASEWRGIAFSNPNDIVVKSDGSIYFTDSGAKPKERPFHGVYRIPANGGDCELVARDFQLVNGLAFSPDESILYINDSHGVSACADFFYGIGTIRAYDVQPDGRLAHSRLFCELRGAGSGVPDGMKIDAAGNVYCTGPDGIWVFSPAGRHIGTLVTGVEHNRTNATNMSWGGADLRTLFVTTGSSLLRLQLKAQGAPLHRR